MSATTLTRLEEYYGAEDVKWIIEFLKEEEDSEKIDWTLLNEWEVPWRNHYLFLEHRGYRLRPRYHPEWVPSWLSTGKDIHSCEDSLSNYKPVLDAVRISDNLKVTLKTVSTRSQEIPINLYFSKGNLRVDPRNRAVPLLDVIPFPGDDECAFIVMPYLRQFSDPPFTTIGECVEAIQQLLQGLKFFHRHNVAHMDACWFNIMMDANELIPRGWHHVERNHHPDALLLWESLEHKSRREVKPVSYYYIDFGLSRSFRKRRLVHGKFTGQDKTVPEFASGKPFDPFMLDIYQLGGVIERLAKEYNGLDFLLPLMSGMREEDPKMRPDASGALNQFNEVVSHFTEAELDNPLEYKGPYIYISDLGIISGTYGPYIRPVDY